jgi:signal transduction histidine kinase
MHRLVTRRLLLLSAALVALAVLIAWSALVSWREIRKLRSGFTTAQLESIRIADQLQRDVFKLDSQLLKYRTSRSDEDWSQFEREIRTLNAWLDQQKTALATPEERALLSEIGAASASYLAAARPIVDGAKPLDQLPKIEAAEQRLLSLGLHLADTHQETLGRFIVATQQSLTRLQAVVFAALLALVFLAAWAAAVVYREMIAPLRSKLIESEALLERQEKLASLGVLASGVAHEIRNPLTAIKARLYTHLKALSAGSRERSDAEFIGKEIDRLERIVRDFLRFAKPAVPERARVSPAALLRELYELMAPQIASPSVSFVIERVVETPIMGDAEQLKQVLINLIQNAAESLSGGGKITLRALDDMLALGGVRRKVVVMEVTDTGAGIPPEIQERLFDPFFTSKEAGTGLGLAIAARIVEKHGGALRFQTAVNRGSTFGIVLPAEP